MRQSGGHFTDAHDAAVDAVHLQGNLKEALGLRFGVGKALAGLDAVNRLFILLRIVP